MSKSESGLEKLTDTLETVITGIPAPIRKNFFKAFGQLCTAAVDVPVALLEGKATEIRALTEARLQIIKKEGGDFSEKTEVPKEYIARAANKYASKIIKEQVNLDDITLNAAQDLKGKRIQENESIPDEIGDDWLNEFESHAKLKSSDDMKLVFGKILSGEILKPGTFSIRTIKLISQLDNQAAKLFQTLCSQAVTLNITGNILDARVVSFDGSPGANSLSRFGLSFDNLNILQEYGLVISDYNSYMHYNGCIAHGNFVYSTLGFGGKHYGLVPTDSEQNDKEVRLSGIALTRAGRELLNIIPIEEKLEYKAELFKYLESKHFTVVDVRIL